MNNQQTRDVGETRDALPRFALGKRPQAENGSAGYEPAQDEYRSPATLLREADLAQEGIMAEADRMAREMEDRAAFGGDGHVAMHDRGPLHFVRKHIVQIGVGAAALGIIARATRNRARSAMAQHRKSLRAIPGEILRAVR